MTFQIVLLSLAMLLVAVLLALLCWWFHELDNDRTTWRFGMSFALAILAVVLVAGAFAFPISVASESIVCRNKAANLELPYRYSFSAGCYVRFHGQWIGIDKALGIVAR